MEKFKELSKAPVKEREEAISKKWDEMDLLKRSVESREGAKPYVFFEGPPTANGHPGIHHVLARTLKDLNCRYHTMKGYQVKRKAGWDTHGLPVEIGVEKELGLESKQEIEEYGVEAFNKKCRESVFVYEKEWREMTRRMAYLVDMDHPYITLDNNYIESVWHILDKLNKQNMIYEGHKILPYCPRCGTGLASHEVALGYKMIKTRTVVARFKKKNTQNEYFLAWTTTPWTLPSNVALTVHADAEYVKVKQGESFYYLAEALVSKVLEGEYEIVEHMKGKDLEYQEYEQLLPFIEPDKKAFFVTTADYVTMEDGTGIVHTAPGFGEDDYNTGMRYGLPVLKPVDGEGKFTETPWKGTFVMDADPMVINYLDERGQIYRKQKMEHNYPHCWRCDTPLIYYANPSWYIEETKVKERLVSENQKVNWYPDYIGEKRFGNWLENIKDWALSRSRYWGTPLNIWRCKKCGHTESIGSRKELVEKAIEEIDESIDLHRPYVDDVHLECPHCHGKMTREKDVIDVWFDSGSMPFAQWHYPFEHKDDFDTLFPADFICEGVDQTRGWFHSLMAISVFMTGKAPYRNVLVNDLILDKDGKKMSKSRGNTVNPFQMFDQYGADTLRFYLLYVSPPWQPTKFDEEGLREVESKFFRSIRNIYNFFSLYANTDGINPREFFVPIKERPEIDRWILSKYHHLIEQIEEDMKTYELSKIARNISDFVIEDFSNWYIRRNRRRFWAEKIDEDKKAVYNTTYELLVGLSKLIAPMTPFIAEELYQNLVGGESVHLETYPEVDEACFENALEEKMSLVQQIVTLGRAAREKAQIKVRQALQNIVIDGKYEEIIGDLTDLIMEELNLKEVLFKKDLSDFMNYSLKPNFPVAGPVLGKKIGLFGKVLTQEKAKEFLDRLEEGSLTLKLGDEDVEIQKDYVLSTITAKEGFDVEMSEGVFVVLNTQLTEDLIKEGYAREFISKIQQMRKQLDLNLADKIHICYQGEEGLASALEEWKEFIMTETLAVELESGKTDKNQTDLNGKSICFEILLP